MRILIVSMMLIDISLNVMGMQNSARSINSIAEYIEQRFERTSLHYTALMPFDINTMEECSWRDDSRAQHAALLIIENSQIDDVDQYEISAYEYAEVNQWRLPKLWEVMQAGKLVQDVQKRNPAVPERAELKKWYCAWQTLKKYAYPKSK